VLVWDGLLNPAKKQLELELASKEAVEDFPSLVDRVRRRISRVTVVR
jgi:hypothetical protein